jgi:hypothetical protein
VRNSGERGLERPEDNLWPEWQPFDTSTTKRIARMLIALDTVSTDAWDIEFPSIKRIFSIKKNDACRIPIVSSNHSILVEFDPRRRL